MVSFRLEANETLSHMGHCECDHVTSDRLFLYLPHAILGPGKDRQDWDLVGLIPFCTTKIYMSSWNWLQRIFTSAENLLWIPCRGKESAPRVQDSCSSGELESQLQEKVHWPYALGAPEWQGVFLFVFSHSVLCLLLCIGLWLGAFQKYKHLSPESTHPM